MINYNVCVVTVTYGNRRRFLDQVIARALSFTSVVSVVVVNNASDSEMPAPGSKITILNNEQNEGSAGGYHKGIKYAFDNIDCD